MKTYRKRKLRGASRGDGIKALMYAICEQAVEDYKSLRQLKIIINNRLTNRWPRRENGTRIRYTVDYSKPTHVDELIHFFKSGWFGKIIEGQGAGINVDTAVNHLQYGDLEWSRRRT